MCDIIISFCCLFLKVRYIIVFLEFPIIFVILPLGTCVLSWADYCPLPVSSQTIAFSWQYIFLKSIFSLMWYNFFPSVYFLASYVLLWLIRLCSVVWMPFPHCWAFIISQFWDKHYSCNARSCHKVGGCRNAIEIGSDQALCQMGSVFSNIRSMFIELLMHSFCCKLS